MTIKSYRLGIRRHEPGLSNTGYLDTRLDASETEYFLTGLEEYTLYDLILDANSGSLPSYIETRRTSAESKSRIY